MISPTLRRVTEQDRGVVHLCYRMALGIAQEEIDPGTAEEIFDDYEIRVISQTP